MAVHILPKWFEVRFFAPGKSYQAADPFYAALNVSIFGDLAKGSMLLSRSEVPRADFKELCIRLHNAGMARLQLYREKGRSVPFGRKIWEGDVDALWEVDLNSLPFLRRQTVQELILA